MPAALPCPAPREGLLTAPLIARELLLARGELLHLEQAPNQRLKLLVRQRCKLQQAGVQPLELAFGQGVEVDATNALLGTRADSLRPTKEDLGATGIRDRGLTQTALGLRIRRRLTLSACGPADFIAGPSTG